MPSTTTTGGTSASPAIANFTATAATTYVMTNHSGSVLDLVIGVNSGLTGNTYIVNAAGVRTNLSSDNFDYRLNADESVFLVTGGAAANNTWNVISVNTNHGGTIKPGVGHTDAYDDVTAGLYIGTV